MANAYTTVIPKPTEELPGQGFQIILIAQGPGQKDRTSTYVTHGKTFDLLDLRQKAIDFRDSLNVDDDYVKQIQSIAGLPLDLTPIAKPQPTKEEQAITDFQLLCARYKGVFTSFSVFDCATQAEVDKALLDVQAFYAAADVNLRIKLDAVTRFSA